MYVNIYYNVIYMTIEKIFLRKKVSKNSFEEKKNVSSRR